MSTTSTESTGIVLGSGWLYAAPLSDISSPFGLTTEDEAKLVNLGYIESSAKLIAKSPAVVVEAANAGKVAKFYGNKDVTFETGIISWDLKNVSDLLTGSDYSEANGKKHFLFANSDQAPRVFLRFVHTQENDGKVVIIDMYKCQFNGDLSLDFNAKSAVSFNYSFDVLSKDNGTKYIYFNIDEMPMLTSIAVNTPPTKTTYSYGDMLDLSGMVIMATYADNTSAIVTDYTTAPENGVLLTTGDTTITITYTEYGITKTASQAITISA